MLRFDWKWLEPEDTRAGDRRDDPDRAAWPPLPAEYDLTKRYDRVDVGENGAEAAYIERVRGVWRELVGRLSSDPDRLETDRLEIADWFFGAVDRLFAEKVARTKIRDCVFISHQRADAYRGERVACLADHRGVDVWLDVQNPTLRWLNANPVSAPARSLLVAAIVEIGLLNSTHVIALHTSSSLASRWVPYELARAKAQGVTSTQAAGWFEGGQPPSTYPTTYGDYVQLAVMTYNEPQVLNWLPGHAHAPPTAHCTLHKTKTL